MKLPRDISGQALIKALRKLGYERVRQIGSHIRIRTQKDGEHHETIPNTKTIKVGLLADRLKSIAAHHKMTVEELVRLLEL